MKYFVCKFLDGGKTHIVKQGECLGGIAQRYGLGLEELLFYNSDITSPDNVSVGQVLNLGPKDTEYIVKSGDMLSKIGAANGVSVSDLMKANGLVSDKITIGQKLIIPGKQYQKQQDQVQIQQPQVQSQDTTTVQNPEVKKSKVVNSQGWDFTEDDFDTKEKGSNFFKAVYNLMGNSTDTLSYDSFEQDSLGRFKDPQSFRKVVVDRINRLGISAAQKQALYGNIYVETKGFTTWKQLTYDSKTKKWGNGPGRGIFQFEPAIQKAYDTWLSNSMNKYKTEDQIMNQLNFVVYELNRGSMLTNKSGSRFFSNNTASDLQSWNTGNVAQATQAFFNLVEKAGNPQVDLRLKHAQSVSFMRGGKLNYYRVGGSVKKFEWQAQNLKAVKPGITSLDVNPVTIDDVDIKMQGYAQRPISAQNQQRQPKKHQLGGILEFNHYLNLFK